MRAGVAISLDGRVALNFLSRGGVMGVFPLFVALYSSVRPCQLSARLLIFNQRSRRRPLSLASVYLDGHDGVAIMLAEPILPVPPQPVVRSWKCLRGTARGKERNKHVGRLKSCTTLLRFSFSKHAARHKFLLKRLVKTRGGGGGGCPHEAAQAAAWRLPLCAGAGLRSALV